MRHPMIDETEGPRSSQSGFGIIELIIVVVIILVLAGMAVKWMSPAIRSYRLSGTAFEIAATIRLARIKATTRDARYRVVPNVGARTYRTELRVRGPSTPWTLESGTTDYPLATGVNFDTTGISAAPPGQSTTQATEMVFNTRGLLINDSTNVPVDGRCFYLQGNTDRPLAVCANLAGKVTVYRLFGSVWEVQ